MSNSERSFAKISSYLSSLRQYPEKSRNSCKTFKVQTRSESIRSIESSNAGICSKLFFPLLRARIILVIRNSPVPKLSQASLCVDRHKRTWKKERKEEKKNGERMLQEREERYDVIWRSESEVKMARNVTQKCVAFTRELATNVICQLVRKFRLRGEKSTSRIIFILFAQACVCIVCIDDVARVSRNSWFKILQSLWFFTVCDSRRKKRFQREKAISQ